jgi:hypothetical protein
MSERRRLIGKLSTIFCLSAATVLTVNLAVMDLSHPPSALAAGTIMVMAFVPVVVFWVVHKWREGK